MAPVFQTIDSAAYDNVFWMCPISYESGDAMIDGFLRGLHSKQVDVDPQYGGC